MLSQAGVAEANVVEDVAERHIPRWVAPEPVLLHLCDGLQSKRYRTPILLPHQQVALLCDHEVDLRGFTQMREKQSGNGAQLRRGQERSMKGKDVWKRKGSPVETNQSADRKRQQRRRRLKGNAAAEQNKRSQHQHPLNSQQGTNTTKRPRAADP
jgi:hypothetical protein